MPIYFKNFNSLRFYAFLLVFIGHVFGGFSNVSIPWVDKFNLYFDLAYYGVIFFFILSGFLITSILLKEKDDNKNINIKNFYLKRVRRIWPVYFIVLFIGFIGIPIIIHILNKYGINIESISGNNISALLWFLFFGANFYIIKHSLITPIVWVLWSIAIEEQFYLIWPWFIKYFKKMSLIVLVLLSLFLLSMIFRYYNYGSLSEHLNTLSCIGSLSMGALGAYLLNYNKKILAFFVNLNKRFSIFIYLSIVILFTLICFKNELNLLNPFSMSIIYCLLTIFFLLFLLEQGIAKTPLISFGKNRIIDYLGKISYGLYAYHIISLTVIITIMKLLNIVINKNVLIYILSVSFTFLLTVLLSYLSYKYIESKFLIKKTK